MDDWNLEQMTPFDKQTSTTTLLLLKLLIPYLPPQSQRMFAIYIKFLEFQHTLSNFRSFRQKSLSTQDIFQDLKPYLPSSASESIDNLLNMMSMMEMFQSMYASSKQEDGFDPMSMMKNMLTPEQQGMFDMYNDMFANAASDSEKGGDTSA